MVKTVGKIIVSRRKRVLEYYVFGSEETGFGIRIVQRGSVSEQAEYDNVTKNKENAVALARKLANNIVCPGHLCDILDDRDFRS